AIVGKIAGLSGADVWISFSVAMTVAALTALSYAELGTRFPKSGGVAYFVQKAFRAEWLSLLVGWLMLCTCLVSMATLSKAFSGYLAAFAPTVPHAVIVVGLFLSLGLVNFWGMRESSGLNIFCTTLEVSGLCLVIFVSAIYLTGGGGVTPGELVPGASIPTGEGPGWTPILQGAALAFYAFIGFEDIVNVSEEVKDPERNVPRAILLALGIAGIVYIIVSWLAVRVVSPAELAASNAPLLDVVRRAQPNFPPLAFTIIALFAVLNTTLLNFITASRLLFGMSREGILPAWLGKLHPQRATPYRTIFVILPMVTFLALSGTLQYLAGTTATLILAMFCLVNISLIVIKRREPRDWGFRIPGLIPWIAFISNIALAAFASRESHILAAVLTGLGGVLVWITLVLRRKHSQNPR
ncbi:MAG: APC family permease, partial [Pseudobdellovibrionaceae bacterium]|nr:APC family permease [Pseudobdellovibrionaceae bacterium]